MAALGSFCGRPFPSEMAQPSLFAVRPSLHWPGYSWKWVVCSTRRRVIPHCAPAMWEAELGSLHLFTGLVLPVLWPQYGKKNHWQSEGWELGEQFALKKLNISSCFFHVDYYFCEPLGFGCGDIRLSLLHHRTRWHFACGALNGKKTDTHLEKKKNKTQQ